MRNKIHQKYPRLAQAARQITADAEHWITLHPNGKGSEGTPALINGAGQIIGGAGGKLNGKVVNPKSKSEAKRGTEPQHAPAIWLGKPTYHPEAKKPEAPKQEAPKSEPPKSEPPKAEGKIEKPSHTAIKAKGESLREKLKESGIKAKLKVFPGNMEIIVSTPTYEAEFTPEQQKAIQSMAIAHGLTYAMGTQIDPNRTTNPKSYNLYFDPNPKLPGAIPKEAPVAKKEADPVTPKKRAPFVPAKNTKEAAAHTKEHDLADHADFGKLHVDIANAHNESLHRHLEAFPELRKAQQFVGSMQSRAKLRHELKLNEFKKQLESHPSRNDPGWMERQLKRVKKEKAMANAYAYSASGYKPDTQGHYGVAFNEKYSSKDLKALQDHLDADMKNKFHPEYSNTAKFIFDHEYGHQLDHLLGLRNHPEVISLRKSLLDEDAVKTAGMSLKEKYEHHKEHGTPIRNAVSKYAEQNMAEFIAEAWGEAQNHPNPRPTAKRLAEIVHSEYAKKFRQ